MTLADTNLLSEVLKPNPSEAVLHWLAARPKGDLFTTTVSMAELMYGVAALPHGQRQTTLRSQIERIFAVSKAFASIT